MKRRLFYFEVAVIGALLLLSLGLSVAALF